MVIRKFNESLSSGKKPEEVFCVYDNTDHVIVEVFQSESESESRTDEMNNNFDLEMSKKGIKDFSKVYGSKYHTMSLQKAIDSISEYWSDYYAEHDESY